MLFYALFMEKRRFCRQVSSYYMGLPAWDCALRRAGDKKLLPADGFVV